MEAAETLSTRYADRGFVIVENLLATDEVERLRRRISEIAEGDVPQFPEANLEFEPGADGRDRTASIRKINQCAAHDSVFMDLARDDRIVDVVESLIGSDLELFGSQCFMKPAGGVEKPYHQDSAYFPIEPRALVTCWMALDDVTLENGCLWVVPGSHRGPLHDHSQPWQVGDRMDMQVPDDGIDRDREEPILLAAGSCSFHHSMLLHRSGPNLTAAPRRGLALHYMSSRSRWTDDKRPRPDFPLIRGENHEARV